MVNFKELTIKDLDAIKATIKEVFSLPPWNDDWSDEKQLEEYVLDFMEARNPLAYGLYEDEDLIGVSVGHILHWWGGTEYYIDEICIKEKYQNKGYGTKFFDFIQEDLKKRGIALIYLNTDVGIPAFYFYKKLGFEQIEENTAFFKRF
ncbi:MAG: GNAT family N-acetyltransferase [Clostridia bacterium]|nr:GNAT family N-acetyltransferase [Clostridia bacterium]